ncbi:hypothetical protein Ahy_B04g070487 isoform A [Arachis hypogaea]|uniref:PGG domain-containing protein n=3 Tax=Arachis hypogaea TaxID=3818 RepID=A0A444ZHB8_ARAHY|nr:hypothetical protein Ahy_B04g070487 isoform A [Arachis hypogaea]
MISVEMARQDSTHAQEQLHRAVSADFGRPNLIYLDPPPDSAEEGRRGYLTKCVPLHKAALTGDWKEAKKILDQDPALLTAAITKGWATVLHIAVGANHVPFVKELVKLMKSHDLGLLDIKGNTAFCFAAAVGNVEIARILWEENRLLPQTRGGEGLTPLHMAVLQGRSAMAEYLFPLSKDILAQEDLVTLFFISINSGLYDLALKMVEENKSLATAKSDEQETGLHVLARKSSLCGCRSLRSRRHLLHFCKCIKDTTILKLMKRMWDILLGLDDRVMTETITQPTQAIFIAAEVGNHDFLSVILSTYPDLIWELDTMGRSIIHISVLHRHASIFNLIHEVGPIKDFIVTFLDDEGNNLLHCAAKLPPPNRLNLVSGAALQMMLELSWFEEVKKITPPICMEMRNNAGESPGELFTKEHGDLLNKGESWMKRTAESCMVVSTLIATGVFSAAFSLPGGNNDNTGSPNYLEKASFLVFALSDTMALISSTSSILIFLSIMISRYGEEDFRRSLPLKLMSGLMMLFISIISMMVAFSSAFFVTYYHGLKWVPVFIAVLAFVPIPIFVFLQFPLWSDIVYSAYISSSLFRSSKRMIR